MIARSENLKCESSARGKRSSRFWRYGPLIAWMILIFLASRGELSDVNTSRFVRPLLTWLFPSISEEQLYVAHFLVRKAAHFFEYAIFALLAARAFITSSHAAIRRGFFYLSFLLVVVYSFSDEFHQTFVSSRTGSVYDSFIDIAGGLMALLLVYVLWRRRRGRIKGRGTAMT
jgi:VanZ family protein